MSYKLEVGIVYPCGLSECPLPELTNQLSNTPFYKEPYQAESAAEILLQEFDSTGYFTKVQDGRKKVFRCHKTKTPYCGHFEFRINQR
jgi:hypothetical protein